MTFLHLSYFYICHEKVCVLSIVLLSRILDYVFSQALPNQKKNWEKFARQKISETENRNYMRFFAERAVVWNGSNYWRRSVAPERWSSPLPIRRKIIASRRILTCAFSVPLSLNKRSCIRQVYRRNSFSPDGIRRTGYLSNRVRRLRQWIAIVVFRVVQTDIPNANARLCSPPWLL